MFDEEKIVQEEDKTEEDKTKDRKDRLFPPGNSLTWRSWQFREKQS